MKSLKQLCNVNIANSLHSLLEASLLDLDANLDITDEEAVKSAITKFINDNYDCKKFTISKNPNKDGKYEVSTKYYVTVKNTYLTSLVNDLFVWNEVGGYFSCFACISLQSLEGAPKKVEGDFNCAYCNSLQSLEGSPKEVEGDFSCAYCKSLKSLKGVPEKVEGYFYCQNCKVQFEESDVRAICDVKKEIYF